MTSHPIFGSRIAPLWRFFWAMWNSCKFVHAARELAFKKHNSSLQGRCFPEKTDAVTWSGLCGNTKTLGRSASSGSILQALRARLHRLYGLHRLYRLQVLQAPFCEVYRLIPQAHKLPRLPRLPLMDTLPLNRLRCSGCKSFRPITSFPFHDNENGYRLYTCVTCLTRKRDQYREAKGEFIQERHDRRVLRAKRAKLRA